MKQDIKYTKQQNDSRQNITPKQQSLNLDNQYQTRKINNTEVNSCYDYKTNNLYDKSSRPKP